MKYRLKKDINHPYFHEGIKAGRVESEDDWRGMLEASLTDNKDWFEPVNERIKLHLSGDELSGNFFEIRRADAESISVEQLLLMEQAINGELFTNEDMIEFGEFIFRDDTPYESTVALDFELWLKQRKQQKH